MTYKKIASLTAGILVLIGTFLPAAVSAANASMTLSGSSNSTGNFAVTVYEDSGSTAATTAYVTLNFTGSVSSVVYDYSVGPFKNTTPSGAHAANGTVTGQQPVVKVSFKVNNPSTVTATVSGSSFLKGPVYNDQGVAIGSQTFGLTRDSANFTYTAPSAPAPTTPPTPVVTPQVSGSQTNKKTTSSRSITQGGLLSLQTSTEPDAAVEPENVADTGEVLAAQDTLVDPAAATPPTKSSPVWTILTVIALVAAGGGLYWYWGRGQLQK